MSRLRGDRCTNKHTNQIKFHNGLHSSGQGYRQVNIIPEDILSFESHKGIITIQIGLCSIKNQKGAISITTDFVQWQCPSGSQRNIFE